MSKRGKIYSVACQDFVTYDEVIFFPGENLNIIIGPNGTGKSTLVAAIVIGMGGKPELLSRSSDLMDYIKHGQDTAQVEIYLYDDEESTKSYKRVFNRDGADAFFIDNKPFNRKQFLAQVKQYNIQIDNLCQFLPQDRVQDFAKMNPQELLWNTQISVCSQDVQSSFLKLVEMRKAQNCVGKDVDKQLKEMQDLELKNNALRPLIENMNTRNGLVEDLKMSKAKQTWLEYDRLNAKVVEYETDLKKAKEKFDQANKKLEPVKIQAQAMLKNKRLMEDKIQKETNSIQQATIEFDKHQEKLDKLTHEFKRVKGDYQEAITTSKEREREIQAARTALEAYEDDVKKATQRQSTQYDLKHELEQIRDRFKEYSQQRSQLIQQRDALHSEYQDKIKHSLESVKSRIENMNNIDKRKMEHLKSRFEDAYRATIWLQENSHLFQGRIYKPMVLELKVKDRKNSIFLENTINQRDLVAFTCENKEDLGLFLKKTRVEMKLSVNAVHSAPADQIPYPPICPIQQMRNFGFHTYLLDMVDGPIPILNYLCKTYRIHDVPLGSEETAKNASNVPSHIRVFFTPTTRFAVTASRYSDAKSILSSEIRGFNLLDVGVDYDLLEKQKTYQNDLIRRGDQIRNRISQYDNEIKAVELQISEVNAEKRNLEVQANEVRSANARVKIQTQKLLNLETNVIDLAAEKEKYNTRSRKIISNIYIVHEEINRNVNLHVQNLISMDTQREKLSIFQKKNLEIDMKIHQLQEEVHSTKRLHDAIERHVICAKTDRTKKENDAKKLTDGRSPKDKNFPYKSQFSNLPNIEDEMLQYMTDLQARIDCMAANDQAVMDEYEDRRKKIEKIKADMMKEQSRSSNIQKEIEELHQIWHPVVDELVKTINGNFHNFLASMGLAGEVELTREDEFDYEKYGITIRVKYRAEEQMQTLDRYVQSGGERAVAIAVYTLSLQHISHVPFRCVDEINQGMDPTNERKIFEMLVDETCQPGQSQYFFITPKLLPNLKYNDLMTILIVFNGKHIDDPYIFVQDKIQR